ncbi:hypothetical protein [Gaetbulibacter jejuensis]|uniref:Uncharacterized protein n=1 Tax=Gaetbulibacter jejuensis TaxID=584607 RepID=A0ABP3USM3_9FLAO
MMSYLFLILILITVFLGYLSKELENISSGDASDIVTGVCIAVGGGGASIGVRLGLLAIGGPISSSIFTALQMGV